MTNAELRARIKDLIASGDLPGEQPAAQDGKRGEPGVGDTWTSLEAIEGS